nr:MAG TPA: hypothetical protein [Caudoviricetes sp.]
MSAEPKGQYFHTAILQKAAPIQNQVAFQSLRGTHHRRLESFYWSGQRNRTSDAQLISSFRHLRLKALFDVLHQTFSLALWLHKPYVVECSFL